MLTALEPQRVLQASSIHTVVSKVISHFEVNYSFIAAHDTMAGSSLLTTDQLYSIFFF